MRSTKQQNQDQPNDNSNIRSGNLSCRLDQELEESLLIQQQVNNIITHEQILDLHDSENQNKDSRKMPKVNFNLSDSSHSGDNFQTFSSNDSMNGILSNQNFYSPQLLVATDALFNIALCQPPLHQMYQNPSNPGLPGGPQYSPHNQYPQPHSTGSVNSGHPHLYSANPHLPQSVTNPTPDLTNNTHVPRLKTPSNPSYDTYYFNAPTAASNKQQPKESSKLQNPQDIHNICATMNNLQFDQRQHTFYQEKAFTSPHPIYGTGSNASGTSSHNFQNYQQPYFWNQNIFQNYGHQTSASPSAHQHHHSHHLFGHFPYGNMRNQYNSRNMAVKFTIPMSVIRENSHINSKELNQEMLENTRYFVIRSGCAHNVEQAMIHGVWCSTMYGNETLDNAYCQINNITETSKTNKKKSSDNSEISVKNNAAVTKRIDEGEESSTTQQQQHEKTSPPPTQKTGHVILFFSINHSRSICGVAEMTGRFDRLATCSIWSESRWKGLFPIKWIYIKQVSDSLMSNIILPKNDNKLVTHVKDCTEIWPSELGESLYKIMHNHPSP